MDEGETIVELGIYGIFVGNGARPLNESAGHLLRAKFSGTDEGGVAAGYACLSSPLLCPDETLFPSKSGTLATATLSGQQEQQSARGSNSQSSEAGPPQAKSARPF